jgi:putative NIF3 family GTP cyclohydrolase 1 type 2
MKASEVRAHFQEVGTWVDWEKTCDQFLRGDPETEVRGIATAWIPTNAALKAAAEKGLNLFITHEPAFLTSYGDKYPSSAQLIEDKKKLIDELGTTVMRCHDTWDRMPEVGIPDAWAAHLSFESERRDPDSFYKICLTGNITVEELAGKVRERVEPLGQDTVLILGDRKRKVGRMAVGTGAITRLPEMLDLGADVLLATDDGMNFWSGGIWAVDLGVPVLIVNHATAEKPGMQAMVGYLEERFPGVPVEYIDVAIPYTSV